MLDLARLLFAELWQEYREVNARVQKADRRLKAWARKTETCRWLGEVPGLGPVGSALLVTTRRLVRTGSTAVGISRPGWA